MSKGKIKTRVCTVCRHEQGDDTSSFDARDHFIIKDRDVCEHCKDCPECDRKLANPRRGYDGHVGKCTRCHNTHRRDVIDERVVTVYSRSKGGYTPLLKKSKLVFKIKHYVRLEKEFHDMKVGAVRVIEVGLFFDAPDRSTGEFKLISQIGYAHQRVDKDDDKPNLKIWAAEKMRIKTHPEWTCSWDSESEVIQRHIDKLRAKGWHVVACKDGNGRKSHIRWNEHVSLAEEKRQDFQENFDENAGERHQNRLAKIDRKYTKRGAADETPEWLEESVRLRR